MVIMAVYTIRSYILFTMVTNSGTDNGTLGEKISGRKSTPSFQMQGFLCWLGVWVFLLLQSRVCGIVELNYEFDIVKLIKQLEDTEEYSQKVNVLFVLGNCTQH